MRGTTNAMLLLATLACGCAEPPSMATEPTPRRVPATQPATGGAVEPPALAGITAAHNRERRKVGVPPLRWNPQLAEMARRWASACVDEVAPRGMIDHSQGRNAAFAGPVGENLFATTAPVANPVAAVEDWVSEARDYDLARNTCRGPMCGHYTQVVWKTTTDVGCGVGTCPRLQFRTTLVCNYWPAGNWVGERPY